MNYKMINFVCIVFFHFCTTLNASQNENIPLKVNFSIKQNDEIIDICGILPDPSHINYILSLLNPEDYVEKTVTSDLEYDTNLYRYPIDLSYSNTVISLDTIVATTGFYSKEVRAVGWLPNFFTGRGISDWLIAVGEPHAGTGAAGIIYNLTETGTSFFPVPTYTLTWGGVNTIYTLTTVSVHPDGKHFVVGGVRTPNNVTHRLIYFDELISSTIIVFDFDHGTTIRSVDWSPNGKYLAVAGDPSNSIGLRVYKFDSGSFSELPRCQYEWSTTTSICKVRWHPSGNYLAVGGGVSTSSHNLKILSFNQEALSEIAAARVLHLSSSAVLVNNLDWSDDGERLAVTAYSPASSNDEFQVYDFNTLSLQKKFTDGWAAEITNAVSASPDGAYYGIASAPKPSEGTTYNSPVIKIFANYGWASPYGITNYVLSTTGDVVNCMQWNTDGTFLAFGTKNGNINVLKLSEDANFATKKLLGDLYAMYYSAQRIHNSFENFINPLSIANSNALLTKQQRILSSATQTSTLQISTILTNTITSMNTSADILAITQNKIPQINIVLNKNGLLIPKISIHSTITFDSIAISPNQKYVATSSISSGQTKIYHYNSYSLQEISSTNTGSKSIQWFSDNMTLLLDGGVYVFTGTGLFALSSAPKRNAIFDSDRKYIAHSVLPNFLYIDQYAPLLTATNEPLSTVTSIPVSALGSIDTIAWQNPTTIFVTTTQSSNAFAAYYFNGTSLTLIGTGATSQPINSADVDSFGNYGIIATNATTGNNIFEYSLTPISGPLILKNSIEYTAIGGGVSIPKIVKYSPDNNYIFIGNQSFSGTPENLIVYQRNFTPTSPYNVIKGTSDALSNIHSVNVDTYYGAIAFENLNKQNSSTILNKSTLIIANSNATAGLLVDTSNAIYNFVIPNSYGVVATANLSVANSYASLNSGNQLNINNSNAIISMTPLVIENSNTVAGLLVATSNAVAGLLVATSEAANATSIKATRLNTIDTAKSHVHFNSASITMTYNLNLSTDHQLFVHASGVVNGNGHSITLARGSGTQLTIDPGITTTFQNIIFKDYNDQAISLGAGSSLIFGHNCRVELSEPQTLLRTWSFAGISQLNGLGNALTLGTGPLFLSSLVSSSLQLSNLKLLNVHENNIRAANNNSAINFQDVTLNMSADFTYSVGSIIVQNDLTICGTSTFNYTTIMGCTISPASQLTIDQGVKFNYAPNGNFRNLLSLTDSSARLFFNNATLVATATGPQLTKGTLLVDGIMNIQSAAASTAQAVIFGDSTPTNDLIVTIFPGASINLQTGFLNYANAN